MVAAVALLLVAAAFEQAGHLLAVLADFRATLVILRNVDVA